MPPWLPLLILVSTLAGVLLAAFSMWLQFKEKQTQIDKSTSELEHAVAAQQDMLDAAERRIQNLEAIVTSYEWDAIQENELPEAETKRLRSDDRLRLDDPEDEPSDAERAAQIARRLKS